MKNYQVKLYGQFQGPFTEDEVVAMYHGKEITATTPLRIVGSEDWFELDELVPYMKLEKGVVRWLDVTFDHQNRLWTGTVSVA